MRANAVRALLAAVIFVLSNTAHSQTITRGPYLQLVTPDSATVRWRTDVATDSWVEFSTPEGSPNSADNASLTTEHMIQLTGLNANTLYNYNVGTSATVLAGSENLPIGDDEHYFTTSPATGTDKQLRIWVTGDSGTANADAIAVRDAATNFMGTRPADIWLTLGDNAYPDGTDLDYQIAFFDVFTDILRSKPVWPIPGTHDTPDMISNPPGGFGTAFLSPSNGEAGGVPSASSGYYSFDIGNIHFVVLDSIIEDRSPGSPMLTWLENDLAVNTKLWTIAYWHIPAYKTSWSPNPREMRTNALPILESYGVDLVLSGDVHTYWRSPLLNGYYDAPNTIVASMILDDGNGTDEFYCDHGDEDDCDGAYIKPGNAGTPNEGTVYAIVGSSGKIGNQLTRPGTQVTLGSLGSMVIDVSGNKLSTAFIDDSGNIADRFSIVKGQDIYPPLAVEATPTGQNSVSLSFNEDLDETSAEDITNYSFDNALSNITVTAAELDQDERTVMLSTTLIDNSETYGIEAINVMDMFGNSITTPQTVYFTQAVNGAYQATIDVEPEDENNYIDPDTQQETQVVVLGSSEFDVLEVNPDSLSLGTGAQHLPGSINYEDFDGDSHDDIAADFSVEEAGIVCEAEDIVLSGSTYGGTPFMGSDEIDTPDCETSVCHP
ncbi:MAG: metallophosphoesterase [bacterium]